MKEIRKPLQLQSRLRGLKSKSKTIGFVPTMGALHEGHLALVRKARKQNDIVVVSIFVNPAQFGPNEDLSRYPRPIHRDRKMLRKAGVDFLFYPRVEDMYPSGHAAIVEISSASGLTNILCGKFRPHHFRGVTTVVAKLLQIVMPTRVYFGQKDYQQSVIIEKMIRDLNFPVEMIRCPTVREKNGLAMSSRNQYLTPEERRKSEHLSAQLFAIGAQIQAGKKNLRVLEKKAIQKLRSSGFKVDYFEVREADTLRALQRPAPKMVVLAACRLNKTRLIDNVIIHPIKKL